MMVMMMNVAMIMMATTKNNHIKQRSFDKAGGKTMMTMTMTIFSIDDAADDEDDDYRAKIQSVMDTFANHFVLPNPKLVSLVI